MKLLIILSVLLVVVISVCPNNCSGHGKCGSDGICSCFKKSAGFENDYIGADCSKRGCGSGKSFSSINTSDKYENRNSDDGNFIYKRVLFDDDKMDISENKFIKVLSKEISGVLGIYKISTDIKIVYNPSDAGESESAGKINCYNSNNEFIESFDIIKVIKSESNTYYMKDDNNKMEIGMKCLLLFKYNDLSLINPTKVVGGKVIWKGMHNIFPEITEGSTGLSMGCTDNVGNALTESPISIAENGINIDKISGDIEFTLSTTPLSIANGNICVLLAKINSAGNGIDAIASSVTPDYTKYTTSLPSGVVSNMYDFVDKKIYTVTVKNDDIRDKKYPSNSFGLLNCRIPGNGDIQTGYLFGKKDNNYYILYDFKFVDINGDEVHNDKGPIPSLYYCELNEYDDFSLYHPVELTADCENTAASCSITWNNMCNAFGSYLPSSTPIQFACRDKNTNEVELYDYTIPDSSSCSGGNVEFTMKTGSTKFPSGRICNLIAGKKVDVDGNSVKAVSIDISESVYYKNYLTKKSSDKEDRYYSSLPTAKEIPTDSSSKIYKVNGLNIMSLSSGGIMRCYKYKNGKISINNDNIDLLYKKGNDYYVYNKDVSGNECELLYSHKDMTLYPNTIDGDNKIVKFSKMSYYMELLGLFNSHKENKEYTMLCGTNPALEDGSEYTEYKFTLTSKLNVPYYDSTSDDVEFTLKEVTTAKTINGGDKCFFLSSFDGNKIEADKSDLNNQYTIVKTTNGYTLTPKPKQITVTAIESDNGIYKVSGVEYEKIKVNSAGGLLECRNKNNNKALGLAKVYSYYKENEVNIYTVKYYFVDTAVNDNNPTPEYYNCVIKESYNDLTLYLPPQTCISGGNGNCVVRWNNMNEISPTIYKVFTTSQRKADVNMLCETSAKDKWKLYKASSADSSGSITFTTSDNPPVDNKKCYLITDIKGININDIKNSNLGKIYDIEEKSDGKDGVYTLTLKTTIPTATEKANTVKTGIYELSNVKYDIGSELSCLTYDSNNNNIISSTGLILKKESNEKYLMSFESEKDLSILKCMIINKYNDLSNYIKCTYSQPSCTSTNKVNNALYYLGMKSDGGYSFICGENGKIAQTAITATITGISNPPTSAPNTVTITFSPTPPTDKSTCHLLYSFDSKTIELKESDVKSTNFISITTNEKYSYYESKPNINTKPQAVEDDKIDIIGDIGEIGANLQCKDKKSNKFLGLAVLLGKDENNQNVMKYLFDIGKDSDCIICEVNEIINDLSLIKSDVIEESDCSVDGDCMIIISGILNILERKIFKNENNRLLNELEENEYEVSCVNKENNEVINYIVEAELEMSFDDNAVFMISNNKKNEGKKQPIGMECRLLVNSKGEKLELKESQFGKSLYMREDGNFITTPCIIEDGKNLCKNENDESSIFVKDDLAEGIIKEYKKSKRLFIPIDTKNRTIIDNYLQSGKWISINKMIVQIINVDYKLEEAPSLTRLRELRMLQGSGVFGYYVIISENIDFSPPATTKCSGQGICNRESGLCECYDGYSGDSCQRLNCPSNCNGNGRCVSLSELLNNDEIKNNYGGFGNKRDAGNGIILDDEVYGCLCDKRHRGYDCSLIECPSGVDPEGVSNKDDLEYRDCSGRGICNYENGICECFSGFTGEGCQYEMSTM